MGRLKRGVLREELKGLLVYSGGSSIRQLISMVRGGGDEGVLSKRVDGKRSRIVEGQEIKNFMVNVRICLGGAGQDVFLTFQRKGIAW